VATVAGSRHVNHGPVFLGASRTDSMFSRNPNRCAVPSFKGWTLWSWLAGHTYSSSGSTEGSEVSTARL
jgi:hypothetical protein